MAAKAVMAASGNRIAFMVKTLALLRASHPPIVAGKSDRESKAMIRGIHHVGMNCRDLERMKRFYREAFGFEAVDENFGWSREPVMDTIVDVPGSAAKGCMMRAGQCYIELFEYSAPQSDLDRPLRPYDRGYTHFCIDVTDIAADIAHLKACGMTFNEREFVDAGHVRTLYGYDPEGNVIEVQQCAPDNGFTLEELKAANAAV